MKANLAVDGVELTVYCDIIDGPEAKCHFCEKQGKRQLVNVEQMECDTGRIDPRSYLYCQALERVERDLCHDTAICELGSPCERKFQERWFTDNGIVWENRDEW